MLGTFADRWVKLKDRILGQKDPDRIRISSVHHFIEREKHMKHIGALVEESFSFGLMLFCIGLFLTLGYLLFVFLSHRGPI